MAAFICSYSCLPHPREEHLLAIAANCHNDPFDGTVILYHLYSVCPAMPATILCPNSPHHRPSVWTWRKVNCSVHLRKSAFFSWGSVTGFATRLASGLLTTKISFRVDKWTESFVSCYSRRELSQAHCALDRSYSYWLSIRFPTRRISESDRVARQNHGKSGFSVPFHAGNTHRKENYVRINSIADVCTVARHWRWQCMLIVQ